MRKASISLLAKISRATGADRSLDRRIASELDTSTAKDPVLDYTASVDQCIALVKRVLPGWRWRIGYGPVGIRVYAFVDNGKQRHEAMAPTVPLALLSAMLKAKNTGSWRYRRGRKRR
jgi:hypothetical protein